ncbi:RusA family crossover junction endodeoxyribonuclease [Roseateles sp. MS654]|uniref:RusA family crossover junction endodeoxyribonuclease n=1 Tax=Roseateles sp. MS654 TaxID=3412685 RepID=UPI003C2E3145
MPLIVDFLLPKVPVSHQTKSKDRKEAWRDFVYGRALHAWPATPLIDCDLKFTMVYLADNPTAGDINNFVKPVQDALCSLIYADDSMVLDVSAHMRFFDLPTSVAGIPGLLAQAILSGEPCVYVAISDSRDLGKELT